ncbi:MAG: hypothetical protein HQM09_16720 [Candidatus Riflebacteria bacterium]|nr:hypothetical protein [Candidatus Riflebacteria bacterium]
MMPFLSYLSFSESHFKRTPFLFRLLFLWVCFSLVAQLACAVSGPASFTVLSPTLSLPASSTAVTSHSAALNLASASYPASLSAEIASFPANSLSSTSVKAVELENVPGRPSFSWDITSVMPYPIGNSAVFLRRGRILVVGGNNDQGPVSTFSEYDPETGVWRRLPPMRTARFGHGVAMFRDHLYVFGGVTSQRGHLYPVNSVEIFDFGAGRWRIGLSMPSPRAHFGIAVLRGRIYLAGGETSDGRPLSALTVFNPFKNAWEQKHDLPSPRNYVAMACASDSIFIFGGEGYAGRTLQSVLRYLPADDSWVDAPAMKMPRKNLAIARLGPRLIITGGLGERNGSREIIADTEIFDPQTQHWESGDGLVIARDGARMVAADGRLWLFGGFAAVMQNTIETGRWQIPICDWRIDPELRIQLAFFAEPDLAQSLPARLRLSSPRFPGLAPDGVADITNIRLDQIRGLGFPLPDRPATRPYSFYLKFFKYPPGLDYQISLRRTLDPLLIRESGNESVLKVMFASDNHLAVKKGFIAPEKRTFGPAFPFPPLVVPIRPGDPQSFFDSHLPFASLYVRPMSLPPVTTDDASLAAWTSGAVATCVRDLTSLYKLTFLEMNSQAQAVQHGLASESNQTLTFLDDAECESRLKSTASLRLIDVPRNPMCFSDFRDLPMPQDPHHIFLTGLALIRDERYFVPSNPLAGSLRDEAFLRETIGSPTVRIFEIGSTVRIEPTRKN